MHHHGPSRAARAALRYCCVIFLSILASHDAIHAQEATKSSTGNDMNLSVGYFGQFTNSAVVPYGNKEGASDSSGALLSFHRSYRWYLGYDINYGYTRYSDQYSFYGRPPHSGIDVMTGMHELTAAYLIKGPSLPLRLKPFAELGTGMLIFSPSSATIYESPSAGITPSSSVPVSTQIRVPVLFGSGFDLPLPSKHFGARFEYRGFLYPAPSFGQGAGFETKRNMITSEPAISVYYKF